MSISYQLYKSSLYISLEGVERGENPPLTRTKIASITSRMQSRLCSIAVLSQSSNIIGLFDIYRIHIGAQRLVWIRPKRVRLANHIEPHALLSVDSTVEVTNAEHIQLFTAPALRLDQNGNVDPNSVTEAILLRVSYMVSFWEHVEEYPLYTINPDYMLPWNQTLHTSNTMFHVYQRSQRQFRLQNIPITPSYMAMTSNLILEMPTPHARRELNNDVCPITLDTLTPATTYWTPCGHPFSRALERALSEDPRCPLCRAHCYFAECTLPTV